MDRVDMVDRVDKRGEAMGISWASALFEYPYGFSRKDTL
jgi:hypothetical protein